MMFRHAMPAFRKLVLYLEKPNEMFCFNKDNFCCGIQRHCHKKVFAAGFRLRNDKVAEEKTGSSMFPLVPTNKKASFYDYFIPNLFDEDC